ncbi:hypothetical protein ACLOJK_017846 [Asimina triloba]
MLAVALGGSQPHMTHMPCYYAIPPIHPTGCGHHRVFVSADCQGVAGFVIAGDAIIGFSIVAPDQSDSSSLSSVFPLRRRAILPLFLPALSPVRRGFLSPSSIVFVAGVSRITAAPDFAP